MYSYGSPHTAAQKQDDQHERTFSSCVRIQDVVLKTCLGRWTIGRSGERGSGISVLPARYDDDDDVIKTMKMKILVQIQLIDLQCCCKLYIEKLRGIIINSSAINIAQVKQRQLKWKQMQLPTCQPLLVYLAMRFCKLPTIVFLSFFQLFAHWFIPFLNFRLSFSHIAHLFSFFPSFILFHYQHHWHVSHSTPHHPHHTQQLPKQLHLNFLWIFQLPKFGTSANSHATYTTDQSTCKLKNLFQNGVSTYTATYNQKLSG